MATNYANYRLVNYPFYTPGAFDGEPSPVLAPISIKRPSIYVGTSLLKEIPGILNGQPGDQCKSIQIDQAGVILSPPPFLTSLIFPGSINYDFSALHVSGLVNVSGLPFDYDLQRFREAWLEIWFLELI